MFTETQRLETNDLQQPPFDEEQNENTFESWYEQLLDHYDYSSPTRGQLLEGTVIAKDSDSIIVDVGLKRDAVVTGREINEMADGIFEDLSIGDEVTVYVLNPAVGDQELLVSINKGLELENWKAIEQYLNDETVLDVKIVGRNRGGLLADYENLRGFLPYSQVPALLRMHDRERAEQIKREMLGTTVPVKVIEVDRERGRLIFSSVAAREGQKQKRLDELEPGQIVYGRVVSIVDFGVFVGLGGIDGLVHVSELDWQHVNHPSELFKVGDEIEVQVVDVNPDKERISLSRKALLPSPWQKIQSEFQVGNTVEGLVTKVLHFGAFVEVTPGVEGLIHVSEMGYTSSQEPQESVKRGEKVLVRILSIEPERERIGLSMRQVPLEQQIAWTMEDGDNSDTSAESVEEEHLNEEA